MPDPTKATTINGTALLAGNDQIASKNVNQMRMIKNIMIPNAINPAFFAPSNLLLFLLIFKSLLKKTYKIPKVKLLYCNNYLNQCYAKN